MRRVKEQAVSAALALAIAGTAAGLVAGSLDRRALADEPHGHGMSDMGDMDMPTHKESMGGMEGADPHHAMRMAFGEPGKAPEVTKTIHVQATDQMRFVFDRTDIKVGDVVAFVVTNTGKLKHEFTIGDEAFQRAHAAMMKQMPDMDHHDPNMVTLAPGETKTLIWKFDKPMKAPVLFECHEAGHLEAGMVMKVMLQK